MIRNRLIIKANNDNIRELVKNRKTDDNLNLIDTTNVTDMSILFYQSKFNRGYRDWETSHP